MKNKNVRIQVLDQHGEPIVSTTLLSMCRGTLKANQKLGDCRVPTNIRVETWPNEKKFSIEVKLKKKDLETYL